jgi:Tfp pilus assembly major pilin PilA
LVVIAILAILSTVVIIGYSHYIKRSAIATDNLLVDQLNAHLDIEKTTSNYQNDNDIAIILQANFDRNIPIATKEYGMDIYYNSDIQRFEVISNDEADDKYQNLNYYFNLSTFHISNTYFEVFEDVKTFENTDEQLCSYIQNNNLYIADWGNAKIRKMKID